MICLTKKIRVCQIISWYPKLSIC